MSGSRGRYLTAALSTPGMHPDLLHRFDILLTGIFEAITGKSSPHRTDWLADVLEYSEKTKEN